MKKSNQIKTFSATLLELSKARLSFLVTLTAAAGYWVGRRNLPGAEASGFDPSLFLWTMTGTLLASFGANSLNQWRERIPDSLMKRTRFRPLPAGQTTPFFALLYGITVSSSGILMLWAKVNLLTAALGALVVGLYVLVYTPMKRVSSLCTLVGAICGAIPPMMGWSGATGSVHTGAWILAAILFIWQVPHFLALAWLYRTDYQAGGFYMLPRIDPAGRLTAKATILYAMALLPVSLSLSMAGAAGWLYSLCAISLGLFFTQNGWKMLRNCNDSTARSVFLSSLAYLTLLMLVIVLDSFMPPFSLPSLASILR